MGDIRATDWEREHEARARADELEAELVAVRSAIDRVRELATYAEAAYSAFGQDRRFPVSAVPTADLWKALNRGDQ